MRIRLVALLPLATYAATGCRGGESTPQRSSRAPDGAWEVRYWRPTNVPVLDHKGEVEFILNYPDEVTQSMVQEPTRGG